MPREDLPHELPDLLGRLNAVLRERYRVERPLGRGGMGTVFFARDLRYGRPVAIKVLHPELATTLGAKRFSTEIMLAANLNHPNIVTVFESGEAAGLLYYVMPYVEGESLRDRLERNGPLPVDQAVHIALDVAEALAFAHGRGVVHRDIKPENILLAGHGHASVADFGVACLSTAADERLTWTGLILGSPAYMSPEQADGKATVDGRADLYSLGCVLHEMLAGAPPFGTNGVQATIFRHLTEEPAPLRSLRSEVSPTLETVVLKALEKAPEHRFARAEDLAAALTGRGTVSPRKGKRPPVRIPTRGMRSVVMLGGVALAALLVLIVRPVLQARTHAQIGITVLPFEMPTGPRGASAVQSTSPDRWLANSLALLSLIHVIDAPDLLGTHDSWRSLPAGELSKRAGRRGAKYLITGSLLEDGGERRITVELYATEGGQQIYKSDALVDESPGQTLDRIALEIVRVIANNEDLHIDAVASATTSLTALTQLLEGQRYFWRGETDAAVTSFRRAIAADSTFGPAYDRLSVAETWVPRWDYPAALAAAEAGLRRRDRMIPRWAELLAAQRHYARMSMDSAQYQFQKVLGENPRLADALLGSGEVLYHYGGMLGERPTTALPIFIRLVTEDSTFAPIQAHIVDLALHLGDERLARRYLSQVDPSRRPAREAALALRFGDARARRAALASLRPLDRATITTVADLFIQEELNLPLADSVAALLTDAGRNVDDRVRGVHQRLAALTAQGRWSEGVRLWDSITGGRQFDAWIVHGYLAGHPAAELANPMFAWARAQVAAGRAPNFTPLLRGEAKGLELRDAFRALVHRATLEGDSAEAYDLLRRIDVAAPTAAASDPEPEAFRASLRARLSLLARDTSGAILQLERAIARAPWNPSQAIPLADAAPERLLLARLLAARGDVRGAERRLSSFGRLWRAGDALYLPAVRQFRSGLPQATNRRAAPGARVPPRLLPNRR